MWICILPLILILFLRLICLVCITMLSICLLVLYGCIGRKLSTATSGTTELNRRLDGLSSALRSGIGGAHGLFKSGRQLSVAWLRCSWFFSWLNHSDWFYLWMLWLVWSLFNCSKFLMNALFINLQYYISFLISVYNVRWTLIFTQCYYYIIIYTILLFYKRNNSEKELFSIFYKNKNMIE